MASSSQERRRPRSGSNPSQLDETRRVSSTKASESTTSLCATSGAAIDSPVDASHRQTQKS